jgi:N-acetylmuramoyl-L-alanine amidase
LRSANAGGRVSAHYLIGRDGHVYQLVRESQRAWHAGGGRWGTIDDLNSVSIGIELDNDGHSGFPDAQIASLIVLLDDVCKRQDILREEVIAHADLAPARKTDPGALFPWRRLAQAGFGRWPDPIAQRGPVPADFDPWLALQLVGYRWADPQAALHAFRLHYRGIDDGTSPMGDADRRILYGLYVTLLAPRPAPPPG